MGDDYHELIRERLLELVTFIKQTAESELRARVCVDTAPIIEREYAQRAGIGWIGKNTNLIHWRSGSWYFLAEVLVSVALESDTPDLRGSCGTCTRCIEACPTDAIIEPNVLDSRLCISYLTIELKESIPKALRPHIGNLILAATSVKRSVRGTVKRYRRSNRRSSRAMETSHLSYSRLWV